LVSSKMLDYTTVDFPFTEFPRDWRHFIW
jgi:hypothetical protein